MGHRALVAYERPDGTYTLHRSHWGARNLRLKHAITHETPFAGAASGPLVRDVFGALLECDTRGLDDELRQQATQLDTSVDPDPVAVALTSERIRRDYLDYLHHEAFYEVDSDLDVTASRPLWFGLEYDCAAITHSPTVGHGALQTVQWFDGHPVDDGVRRQFRGLKAVAGDLVDRGLFAPAEALDYLAEKLRSLPPAPHSLVISRRDDLVSIDLDEWGT